MSIYQMYNEFDAVVFICQYCVDHPDTDFREVNEGIYDDRERFYGLKPVHKPYGEIHLCAICTKEIYV